eukprot:900447-Rhodomonas_salina.1
MAGSAVLRCRGGDGRCALLPGPDGDAAAWFLHERGVTVLGVVAVSPANPLHCVPCRARCPVGPPQR